LGLRAGLRIDQSLDRQRGKRGLAVIRPTAVEVDRFSGSSAKGAMSERAAAFERFSPRWVRRPVPHVPGRPLPLHDHVLSHWTWLR
jgi:hypothetical protein